MKQRLFQHDSRLTKLEAQNKKISMLNDRLPHPRELVVGGGGGGGWYSGVFEMARCE